MKLQLEGQVARAAFVVYCYGLCDNESRSVLA